MFADAFLPNLVIFAAGQVVAWLYLRTGRRSRGLALMIGAWVLADVALVQKFAFRVSEGWVAASLLGMQLWSVFEVMCFIVGRIRRRRPRAVALREAEFRRGFEHYVRDELDEAVAAFRRVVRRDPWDVPAAFALGTALSRAGAHRPARAMLRHARLIDVDAAYADAIDDEMRRLDSGGAVPRQPRGAGEVAPAVSPQERIRPVVAQAEGDPSPPKRSGSQGKSPRKKRSGNKP